MSVESIAKALAAADAQPEEVIATVRSVEAKPAAPLVCPALAGEGGAEPRPSGRRPWKG
jgi:hypothetical protein